MPSDTQFVGAIPETYERYLVPLIFDVYAQDLAERVAGAEPKNVLETAAGTGVATRALATRLPSSARVVVTDLNPAMLEQAAAQLAGDARFSFQKADALELPFADRAFDAVVCQFGVMFFPDKLRGYREARRVLAPGGSFFFNVWDRLAENEFPRAVTEALVALFPDKPPLFMDRVPHGYFDVTKICEELTLAGFDSVSLESRTETSRAASARDVAIAFCQGTPLRHEIEACGASRLAEATDHATREVERCFGSGPIESRIRAHVITAVA